MRAENSFTQQLLGAAKWRCLCLFCAALYCTALLALSGYGLNATSSSCPQFGRNSTLFWHDRMQSTRQRPQLANCAPFYLKK